MKYEKNLTTKGGKGKKKKTWFSEKDAKKLQCHRSKKKQRQIQVDSLIISSNKYMDDKNSEEKASLESKKLAFEEIKVRFNKWCSNMYICAVGYILFFIFSKKLLIDKVLRGSAFEKWLGGGGGNWAVFLTAIILGICFILDSVVASHLKSPLQRLNIKIEASPIAEKNKNELMRSTQEANELFKETLKKFGILVIPLILTKIVDNEMKETANKPSESLLFYLCYLIPILFASWTIWKINRQLNKIRANEYRKQQASS